MKKALAILLLFYSTVTFSQEKDPSSGKIYQSLLKLNTVGSAMYIAAHPDDENTLLLTWLSKDQKVQTAYIAMTRGDGGQNLIGTQQGADAGVLRTQELLKARSVDGAQQFFTRAIDFGYTKTTNEALQTWGKQKVLGDFVYRIRKFQPDVLITRFPPDDRAGHGHHSASAVLAAEAFDAAADPTKFPEQLKEVTVWQSKRLVWNTYSRGFTNQNPEEGAYIPVSLGGYNSVLGQSYPEIAAEARSMHKSQGFGSAKTRDERTDYLLNVKGEAAKTSLFDGVDISWNRLPGGKQIGNEIDKIIKNFNFTSPKSSVSDLLKVYKTIQKLPYSHYKQIKLNETKQLIADCAGLWMEAVAANQYVSQGDSVKIFFQANNRSDLAIQLKSIEIDGNVIPTDKQLIDNKLTQVAFDLGVPMKFPITQPYWLIEPAEKGFYKVSDEKLIGLPFQPEAFQAEFTFDIAGDIVKFDKPVIYKYVEPSIGEIYQPFIVRPEVMVNFKEHVFTFTDNQPKNVAIVVKSSKNNVSGAVRLDLPKGWKSQPETQKFKIVKKNNEEIVTFQLMPPTNASEIELKAIVEADGQQFNHGFKTINYSHIPLTTLFPEATAKAIRIDLKTVGKTVGYVLGAGDDVPDALKTMGYGVTQLNEGNFLSELTKQKVIIIGVRAYNTEDWLPLFQNQLMDFVKNGGTLITQYQTSAFYGTIKADQMGPYPFTVSRDRVTDETAKVEFVNPNHPLLNKPNKITQADFDGWVQERGLYFANSWAKEYTPIFKMKDAGESESEGSLLYTKYGKGNFIFTGLAFFRQLPAGVPGAYRLMANLIAVGQP